MFWELAQERFLKRMSIYNVPKLDVRGSAGNSRWRRLRDYNPRTNHLREYTLKDFWEVCVDDSPFGADALLRQVNVHSKAVFSNAMTLMDKIRGCEDEWVGSKFAACMWIYTKEAWTKGQILGPEQEEYLEKRMLSIVICTNRVRAGAFVDHEWVSERTNIQHEEEILGLELNYKIHVPCVVQWSLSWFSAPTELNNIMLTSVARVLPNTHKNWGVEEELEWWMTKDNLVTSSSSDDDEEGSSDE